MTTLARTQAACADRPDWWLSGVKADRERAVAICHTCPLEQSCRDGAVSRRLFDAVRGGLTGPELRKLAGPARRTEAQHGTNSKYIGGCRCSQCRRARARYVAHWRATRTVTSRVKVVIAVLAEPAGRGRRKAWAGQMFFQLGEKR